MKGKTRPTSADDADKPNPALRTSGVAELFLLMVVRLWRRNEREPGPQDSHWWEGFLAVGIDRQACAAFDIFMQILCYGSRQSFRTQPVKDPQCNEDEQKLLRFVSAVQHHQYSRSLELLEHWLSEEELELIWEPAQLFIAGLNQARLLVPLGQEDLVSTFRLLRCSEGHSVEPSQIVHSASTWLH